MMTPARFALAGRGPGWPLVLVGVSLLVGCSAVAGTGAGSQSVAVSGSTPAASQGAVPSSGSPAGGSSTGPSAATSSGGTGGSGEQTASPGGVNLTRYPTPPGMTPPTATAAAVVGCQPLAGGGWQATFVVTLAGGTQWAVIPQHGPATHTGADKWTVVIRQPASGGVAIALTRIDVGGGSPYRTSSVALGPGVAVTAACPS